MPRLPDIAECKKSSGLGWLVLLTTGDIAASFSPYVPIPTWDTDTNSHPTGQGKCWLVTCSCTALAEPRLLDHAGEIFSETTGARRGGDGFWGYEIQIFIVGDLVEVVPVLQQLPAQVLVHLLGAGEQRRWSWLKLVPVQLKCRSCKG